MPNKVFAYRNTSEEAIALVIFTSNSLKVAIPSSYFAVNLRIIKMNFEVKILIFIFARIFMTKEKGKIVLACQLELLTPIDDINRMLHFILAAVRF